MKVLKDNYSSNKSNVTSNAKSYPRKLQCERCSSELQYDKSDLRMGQYGCMFVDCPLCGYDNMLDDNEYNITLTIDNIEFPTHFHHTSTETGAVDVCNNENIRKYIREAVNYLRENQDEYVYGGHITGNLYILVNKLDGDENYEVTVSNDFYSMYIPFEDCDY